MKRRKLLQMLAAGTAFYGPWTVNRVWSQAAQKKPLVIGLTMDASGQYAASGGEERLGAMMAIKEFNDKGGVLGRRELALHEALALELSSRTADFREGLDAFDLLHACFPGASITGAVPLVEGVWYRNVGMNRTSGSIGLLRWTQARRQFPPRRH